MAVELRHFQGIIWTRDGAPGKRVSVGATDVDDAPARPLSSDTNAPDAPTGQLRAPDQPIRLLSRPESQPAGEPERLTAPYGPPGAQSTRQKPAKSLVCDTNSSARSRSGKRPRQPATWLVIPTRSSATIAPATDSGPRFRGNVPA